MRRLLLGGGAILTLVLLLTRAEPFGPRATLETPGDVVGRSTTLEIVASDRGSGLASIWVRLVPLGASGPRDGFVVARETFARRSWLGSGVGEAVFTPTLDVAGQVPEGKATLEIWAADHSWLQLLRRQPRLTRLVTVDLTPPTLQVVSTERVTRAGGSACVLYRAGSDTTRSGVQVGDTLFAGTPGLFTDGTLHAAFVAVPQETDGVEAAAIAVDAADNRRTLAVDLGARPRRFSERTLTVGASFLEKKVPSLLAANGLVDDGDLVAGYLRINRNLRAATEARVREICRESAPRPLWEGAFLRLPGSASLSTFGDRRTYVHDGKVIDHQTHLGYDLASLRASPVPAANAGRVAFAGALGIYGDTVILDHGLGLFSLYGHLSEIHVTEGSAVGRGDVVGRTGESGLAGGDHLHFSIMIRGVHVDPVEWWDERWIRDHVEARLAAYPRTDSQPVTGAPSVTP